MKNQEDEKLSSVEQFDAVPNEPDRKMLDKQREKLADAQNNYDQISDPDYYKGLVASDGDKSAERKLKRAKTDLETAKSSVTMLRESYERQVAEWEAFERGEKTGKEKVRLAKRTEENDVKVVTRSLLAEDTERPTVVKSALGIYEKTAQKIEEDRERKKEKMQKDLEDYLTQGNIYNARFEVIAPAENARIDLNFERPEFVAACQKGLETLLSSAQMDDVEILITLVDKYKVKLNFSRPELVTACQKGLSLCTREGANEDYDKIVSWAGENGIALKE